jgi:hypothetical protein
MSDRLSREEFSDNQKYAELQWSETINQGKFLSVFPLPLLVSTSSPSAPWLLPLKESMLLVLTMDPMDAIVRIMTYVDTLSRPTIIYIADGQFKSLTPMNLNHVFRFTSLQRMAMLVAMLDIFQGA